MMKRRRCRITGKPQNKWQQIEEQRWAEVGKELVSLIKTFGMKEMLDEWKWYYCSRSKKMGPVFVSILLTCVFLLVGKVFFNDSVEYVFCALSWYSSPSIPIIRR
ncbi:hypothetical protein STEG23_026861, partial [Scotinomys teguina]